MALGGVQAAGLLRGDECVRGRGSRAEHQMEAGLWDQGSSLFGTSWKGPDAADACG